MIEYDTMYLVTETLDQTWSHLQFWSSVSFGYLVLSHAAGKSLNIPIIVVISVLYIAFTFQTLETLTIYGDLIAGYREDLVTLQGSKGLHSEAAKVWVENSRTGSATLAMTIALFGTFLAAIFYLPYCYYRGTRGHT